MHNISISRLTDRQILIKFCGICWKTKLLTTHSTYVISLISALSLTIRLTYRHVLKCNVIASIAVDQNRSKQEAAAATAEPRANHLFSTQAIGRLLQTIIEHFSYQTSSPSSSDPSARLITLHCCLPINRRAEPPQIKNMVKVTVKAVLHFENFEQIN
ncbi:hypothetical protein LOAG_04139 [Loa loa]|uniref:Uncharacterized protein n=1 Tax=Loa loa TaxID=7209 RepID=A0A1S0U397_LOALO|nr:hypothetical protein LOAG_04139 [Loa loa]EFO24343.1 hypothetical protein LOAG_04139 [Loa loa]